MSLPWPCARLSPVVDSIAAKYAGRAKVSKINVFENFELAARYRVSAVPQLFFFKGSDSPAEHLVGFQTEEKLTQVMDRLLQAS